MSSSVQVGALAFVGLSHVSQLTDFQYVEVVGVTDSMATVKVTGPDDTDQANTFEVTKDIIGLRLVSEYERKFWPGSYIAHPVAFVHTSQEGIDAWSFGVVSGYTASETTDILHIVSSDTSIRFPLTNMHSVIKVDSLNYALRPGQGVNAIALSPMELLRQQDALLASCRKRRSGIPASVMSNLSAPYSPDDKVPLVKPDTLQLVRVRRQHIVDFSTGNRANRPSDLYTDITADDVTARNTTTASVQSPSTTHRQHNNHQAGGRQMNVDSSDDDQRVSSSDDEDIREVQHMHAPLSKRRRVTKDVCSDSSDDEPSDDQRSRTQRGIVFHPSPTDRRIHGAIVNSRHTGKIPQTLLQSIQQSPHVPLSTRRISRRSKKARIGAWGRTGYSIADF